MAVNLSTYGKEIGDAWKEISKSDSENDWALFGYEGKTFDLKLIEKGDGGLEELEGEFNSGKILYAVCRVKDPNTALPKLVFINWQGEGVPATTKGKCANHLRDVQGFFRGTHVAINARSDDDIDPDTILAKVKASSGSNYSIHKEKAKAPEPFQPVGTNYKRATPIQDITSSHRDQFWTQQEEEEKKRIQEESEKRRNSAAAEHKQRKQQEAEAAAAREAAFRERSRSIDQQRAEQKKAAANQQKDEEKRRYEQTLREAEKDDSEFRGRADSSRTQRLKEARELIKQRSESVEEPDSHVPATHAAPKQPPPVARKVKAKVPPPQKAAVPPPAAKASEPGKKAPLLPPVKKEKTPIPKPEPVREPSPEPVPQRDPSPEPVRDPSPEPVRVPSPEPVREPSPEPVRQPSPVAVREPSPVPVREPSPEPQPEQATTADEDNIYDTVNDETVAEVSNPVTVPYSTPHQPGFENYETIDTNESAKNKQDESKASVNQSDDIYETIEQTEDTLNSTANTGMKAKVLYDYEAVDDSELTIDIDEIITEIEQIDEGWWRGRGPSGASGLFPANYVELISDTALEPSQAKPTPPVQQSQGLKARALYDYQAVDDSEITFDPDDVITDIEQIDEGWWRGTAPNGHYGLFPANYVELM